MYVEKVAINAVEFLTMLLMTFVVTARGCGFVCWKIGLAGLVNERKSISQVVISSKE